MKNLLKIMLTASLCVSASIAAPQKGSMTDPRDGKTYKTVKIGDQVWMAENLNYEKPLSYCYGDTHGRDEAECVKYGRLYKWKYAIIACPAGWHLPSVAEFETLFDAVGGKSVAGSQLGSKLEFHNGWGTNYGGADAFGFSAHPFGTRNDGEDYSHMGLCAFFWSSTADSNSNGARRLQMCYDYYYKRYNAELNATSKDEGLSVRCLKDDDSLKGKIK